MEGYVDQISIMLEIRDSEELSTMKLLASQVKKNVTQNLNSQIKPQSAFSWKWLTLLLK